MIGNEILNCAVGAVCSGCPWIGAEYADQIARKVNHLIEGWVSAGLPADALASLRVRPIAPSGLRDRVDLILRDGRLGLFDREHREIVSPEECAQMSPGLWRWYARFREMLPPIRIGSVRLRVSPSGLRGAWLDFANTDIKRLLDDATWLRELEKECVVEIGQKRKSLETRDGRLALGKPRLEPWISTFLGDKETPLYCAVGSFTQVGTLANRVLVNEMRKLLPVDIDGRWLELGAGGGNLTLPLAAAGAHVEAVENDPLALDGLNFSAERAGLSQSITPHALSFHQPTPALAGLLAECRGILADPPRSGLGKFLDLLNEATPPDYFVYISCFAESFTADSRRLYDLGYRLQRIAVVDQFPQSPHAELVSCFTRS